jgi:hypothetical protein
MAEVTDASGGCREQLEREKKRTACATSRVAGVTALIEPERRRPPQPGELS